jgi:phosphohistidine phosphatase
MQLFVIRHGIAEDAAVGQDDPSRELTGEGRKKMKRIAKGMHALDLSFGRILTSPWGRAAQTAALLARRSKLDPIATDLLCQSPRAELLALIAGSSEPTAVVGHQPWLGELIAWLAFGDTRHGEQLELKKGALVWLEGATIPGGMVIRAALPPKLLALAG